MYAEDMRILMMELSTDAISYEQSYDDIFELHKETIMNKADSIHNNEKDTTQKELSVAESFIELRRLQSEIDKAITKKE